MPLALLIVGIIIAVTAFRNTYRDVGTLVVGDLTGAGNFLVWIGAIVIVGAAGYIEPLKYPSRLFLGLIILAMFLSNKGVFAQFTSALQGAQQQQTPITPEPSLPGALPVSISGGGAGGAAGAIGGAAGAVGSIAKAVPLIGGLFG